MYNDRAHKSSYPLVKADELISRHNWFRNKLDMNCKIFSFIMISFLGCAMLSSCKNQTEAEVINVPNEKFRAYNDQRIRAINRTVSDLDIKSEIEDFTIYGVAMDWNIGNGRYVTVCSYLNGRSILLSSDGTKDLDLTHNNLRNATKPYLQEAAKTLTVATNVINYDLPVEGAVKFYYLTNLGLALSGDNLDRIESGESALTTLFERANQVIAEIRNTYLDFAQEVE